MASLKELRDAANSWASQEATDIASGAKQEPIREDIHGSAGVKENPSTFPGRMLRKAQSMGMTSRDTGREAAGLTRAGAGPLKTKFDAPSDPYIKEHTMPDTDFKDLGEAKPGASLAQAARSRGIAASLREGRSSVSDTMSHEAPTETDLHSGGKPWTPAAKFGGAQATDTGDKAGAFSFSNEGTRQPKDLGRVTAKVARGEYGDLSPKTASQVKGSFLGRAAESIAGKVGSTLGAYGGISLAAKASEAYQGLKRGDAVNPLTLDTVKPKVGDEVLTITGKRKIQQGDVKEEM